MEILELTKSKTKEKILRLFFSAPEKSYYLRQMERMINVSVGTLRREILVLKEKGIFKSEHRGNLLYFFLNKEYPLYKELKNIIFKTIGAEGALKKELSKISGIKEAYIYGSFARGEEKSLSDIDILIIGSINENEFIDLISKLEQKLDREINYTLMTEKEFRKKLKEKNSFLENILKQKKIKLL